MKTLTAASIATIGFATFGMIQGDADAAENVQPSAYTTTFSQQTNDYITIDEHGNYHHTLDGHWNTSMFEQGLYQSSYTDEEGRAHYVYYSLTAQDDNNYAPNSTYHAAQAPQHSDTHYRSHAYNQSLGTEQANTTDQTGYGQRDTSASSNQTALPETQVPQQHATTTGGSEATSGWLKNYPKWQPYGQYTTGGTHYGVDYGMPEYTPVYSFTNGKVINSGWSNYGGGNQITIQEANSNNYQWYMHMNQLNVQAGDTVTKGQQIGLTGNTGNSTGPHLHFQRMSGGIGNQYAVNPDNYLANQ